jgi:Family of unknown function (DUF6446)
MNATRFAILGIVVTAFVAGVLMYWLQIHAFYTQPTAEQSGGVQMVSLTSGMPEDVPFADFRAVDADSSPIRFRACFTLEQSQAMLTETYRMTPGATPLVAPGWFDCFDAETIGNALAAGQALAFMGHENISYGVDRVIAVFPDGQAFAWHQINACGETVFNGEPAPEGCPPVPEGLR